MNHLVVAALLATSASADTVTTRGHVSVNGRLIELKDGVIHLAIRSPKGPETRYIHLDEVAAIEFNSTDYNPGAPPRVFGVKPQEGSGKEPPAAAQKIVLRGNDRRDCKLLSINATAVVCEGKNNQFARGGVIRILVEPR